MKVMFAGLGSIGQRHLRNIVALQGDDLELIAYRVRREVPVLDSKMKVVDGPSLAERYGIDEFDTLDSALAERPDVVFVTNPSSMHMEVALAALKVGAHVFIEKPLANSLEGLPELMDAATGSNLVVGVGYQFRSHLGAMRVKDWLEQGRIGPVVKAHFENGEYLPNWHPYEDYRTGYAARADLGGGALLTQIHDFDMVLWLLGMPEIVYAVGGQLSDLDIDVEDSVTVLMTIPRGGRSVPVTVDLDYVRRLPSRRFTIIGARGQIEWNFHAETATCIVEGEADQQFCWAGTDRNEMFLDELQSFLSAIKAGGRPQVDLYDGAASLRLALAAARSLKSGKPEKP